MTTGKQRQLPLRSLTAAAAMLSMSGSLLAATIGPQLTELLTDANPAIPIEIVISYDNADVTSGVTPAQLSVLNDLGIASALHFTTMPIAGALATPAQIDALASQDDVLSLYFNAPLEYYNQESREISSVARAQANQADFGRPIPFSGQGVTAVVNDSGVDATHADLSFGSHVVENVQALTNLRAIDTTLPVTFTEGQQNTDTNSGHGTHVAGTFGGNGARSNGLYAGVAPGADIVGYGSGGVILILDGLGGFEYANTHQFEFANPIRLITNSWGGASATFDPSHPINVGTYATFKRGITVLFAAGNDGSGEDTHNHYAQAPWVISVAATRKDGSLEDFSSRGQRGETSTFTQPDGITWVQVNEPSIAATGVDVISARAATNAGANGGEADLDAIAPQHLPFYTMISGTSMATPHVAGIVALLLEANPALTPLEVKEILQLTATNVPSRETWEIGAGHVNAYAALAMASGLREDFGDTVNAFAEFNANALLSEGDSQDYSLFFSPVGDTDVVPFEVGANTVLVSARAELDSLGGEVNTVALRLTDPDGIRYGSAIALPVLGEVIGVSAPGKPGTWTISVGGIGSISGNAVDPLGVTNGLAAPGTVDATVSFLDSNGFEGLDDISGHPAQNAIQAGVFNRLVDGLNDGRFRPNSKLNRRDLARYLVMGAAVRQELPLDGSNSFQDVDLSDSDLAFVEAATSPGGALKDRAGNFNAVLLSDDNQFNKQGKVTREELAYTLVQSLGLENDATGFDGDITVEFNGDTYTLTDQDDIDPALRGYVQGALSAGLLHARFSLEQGPFDPFPTLQASFQPTRTVTRAEYAVAATLFAGLF